MNAAARLVHQRALTRHLVLTHFLTWRQVVMLILSLSIVFSALSIIYVTHLTRSYHALYQRQLLEQNHVRVLRSQLLLERSTEMSQSRIQQAAEKKLGMMVPDHQSVVIIRQ